MKVPLLSRSLGSQNMGTHLSVTRLAALMGLFFYLNSEVKTWRSSAASP